MVIYQDSPTYASRRVIIEAVSGGRFLVTFQRWVAGTRDHGSWATVEEAVRHVAPEIPAGYTRITEREL